MILLDGELGGVIAGLCMLLFYVGLFLFFGYVIMKVLQKAGYHTPWHGFIPIYSSYLLATEVVGRESIWGIITIFFPYITLFEIHKCFNKSAGFGIGLALLSPIFLAILAFGSDQYKGKLSKEEMVV